VSEVDRGRYRVRAAIVLALVAAVLAGCGSSGGGTKSALKAAARYFSGPVDELQFQGMFNLKRGTKNFEKLLEDALGGTREAEQRGMQVLLPAAQLTATLADDFLTKLRGYTSGVVTLIGHNDEGRFYFADRSWVGVDALAAASGGARVAIISCESARYASGLSLGVPSKLSYEVAHRTEAKFLARLENLTEDSSNADLQAALTGAFNDAVFEMKAGRAIKGAAVAGVTGAGITIVELLD
jgi:hypothetical protein